MNMLESTRRELLTEILDGTQYQIAEILDLDDDVLEAYQDGRWNTLRCSSNGYRLIELLKTRRSVADRLTTAYDDIDGFAPPTEEDQARLIRERMHDEEFRYCTETDTATEEDFDRWEREDADLRARANQARIELKGELVWQDVDPTIPAVKTWIRSRFDTKASRFENGTGPLRQLATYKSCLYILDHGFRTPFPYAGLQG